MISKEYTRLPLINEEEIMSEIDSIKPLGDRVVIQPKVQEEKTQGGIYIPTPENEKVMQGQVVAVGTGKVIDGKTQKMVLNVGQNVAYNQYSATDIEHAGAKYSIVREDDVIAIIE